MHGVGGLVGNWVAGASMAAIGLLILRLNARSAPNRAFAALLIIRGLSLADGFLAAHDAALAQVLLVFEAVVESVLSSVAILFGLWWPKPHRFARSKIVWLLLALLAIIPLGMTAIDPGSFLVVGRADHGGFEIRSVGIAVGISEFQQAVYAGLGLVFAVARLRAGNDAQATGFLLVATGFSLGALFLLSNAAVAAVGLAPAGFEGAGATIIMWMYVVAGLLALASSAVLAVDAFRRPAQGRAQNLVMLFLLAAAFALGLVNLGRPEVISSRASYGVIAVGLLRLGLPILVGFAIARHQLPGLDLRAKWTLEKGTLAAIFIAVFFVVSEGAAEFFGQRTGSQYYGIAAAALLVFALHPLQRLVERLSSAAVPGVEDTAAWRKEKAQASFRLAIEMALADGRISRREEEALARLADTLELPASTALTLRREVEDASRR